MKILIAVPTFETIAPETFKSIYGLHKPGDATVLFDFVKGYDCAKARTEIAREALHSNFDYVLMVDSDIILPSTALVNLLDPEVDICLGVYPRKNTSTGQTEIFKLGCKDFVDTNNLNIAEIGDPGRIDIKGGGLGCALINTQVFRDLELPWFSYVQYKDGNSLSEDNFFCYRALLEGKMIQADTRVRCGHLVRKFIYQ